MYYFGSHVSISKGYLEAAKYALKIGAKSFQYFPKNPRSLTIKKFDAIDARKCAEFSKENGLLSIAHTPYPTNLAVDDDAKKEIMVASILNDLEIAESCGSIGIVVHFGKYTGADTLKGYRNIINLLNTINDNWSGKALLLIENQASIMGKTLEELVQIQNLVKEPEKIGFCFDTCHAFASGIWKENWYEVLELGENLGYFQHLKAIHLNDSIFPTESFRDRHANIGKGYIGERRMKELIISEIAKNIPLVLETPQSRDYTHRDEIGYLHSIIKS